MRFYSKSPASNAMPHDEAVPVTCSSLRLPDATRRAVLVVAAIISIGCHTTTKSCDGDCVTAKVIERSHLRSTEADGAHENTHHGIVPTNGISEDDAVVFALWNNAAFHEQLAELHIAQADLVQAGLLPNPEFIYCFNAPDKPFKYLIEFPIEALWLRPIRIAAADRESQRVCDRLKQLGLDLIRDVRQVYADVLLARGRMQVIEVGARIRGEIAKIADARFRAGDVGPQEAATARIDMLQSQQELNRASYDVAIAEQRLRNVMGVAESRDPIKTRPLPIEQNKAPDEESLTAEAVASRPDALAAEQAAAAAAERVRLTKLVWFRVLGIGDATSGRNTGHEFSPAIRFTLPICNWNQGNIARAEAEHERLERARHTLRQQIVLDVRQASLRYAQALTELEMLNRQVLPEVEAAIRRAETAYREGNAAYVIILETTRQLLDSRLRRVQLEADLRRARAELERSVGRHIEFVAAKPEGVSP